jgi:redox-sensing transcriptional repressor
MGDMKNETFKFMPVMSVKRLSAYLRFLRAHGINGPEYISGAAIAEEFGTLPVQVRKDLQCAGVKGAPRLGYPRKKLIAAIESFLGWDNSQDAFLVGAGNLGAALLAYKDFERDLGLKISAAFDIDPAKHGTRINGVEVLPVEKLGNLAARMQIKIGIIAIPPEGAQEIASTMANAGIRAIWNFAPVNLHVPSSLILENVSLSASLSVLTSKLRKTLEMERAEKSA